ncbi:MAG TPA: thiamine-phosphate kinase [Vicinamibacterales bacterium]|nr:thiamine-phosphate kinase [Vicinamibacterales bacterium]
MTVASLTERELIARIRAHLPPAPPWVLVGIGDDAAVVEPERNRVEVLTVDASVDGVHFDRALAPPDAIGHRALAVNLSDLAAMGAAPRLALLSMALPPTLPLADFDAIVGGFAALAARHGVQVVGGNLTRTPGPLTIDVTVMGTVKRRQALTRAGARPGDDLYVSGTIGTAAAGLRLLQSSAGSARSQSQSSVGTTEIADSRLIRAYLTPEPRVALGVHLARNRAASACMDLSDGLSDGLEQVADASGVGMTIDGDAVPIDAGARAVFAARGEDAVAEALRGGDDYELLIAVRPRTQRRLTEAIRRGGVPLTRIGRCTAERGITVRGAHAASPVERPQGFSHFASVKGSRSGA